jgi:hypothetical protein
MHSDTHFLMPSVRPGHTDLAAAGGSDQHPAATDHGHHYIRVAVGGRVIEHEVDGLEARPAPSRAST